MHVLRSLQPSQQPAAHCVVATKQRQQQQCSQYHVSARCTSTSHLNWNSPSVHCLALLTDTPLLMLLRLLLSVSDHSLRAGCCW